jgi:hypothetical protein
MRKETSRPLSSHRKGVATAARAFRQEPAKKIKMEGEERQS